MLQILKSKLQRAEHQERLAELLTLRKADSDDVVAGLLPGPSWERMAKEVSVPLANIVAVFNVESRGSGFGPDGRLTVLYEPHVAYKYAKRAKEAQAAAPDLFYPNWIPPNSVPKSKPHAYRTSQEERWDMIARAAKIDFNAAVSAVSWGRFQVMGYWAQKLDFTDTMHMIEHMYESEANHLDVFFRYCAMAGLMTALRRGDWWAFSRYNSNLTKVRKEYAAKCLAEAKRAGSLLA
ncbi:N-acetylmuramidase [uncultured Caudovirales phage]|uniref:N-acetylmuramidase n=1 Tax=uncultured Caudovirales phage TaxID=2100421 RepID=A0A6J5M711_9CAUD|nr:N-acetylmuramidase [uncultured Caudovirales phage]